MIEVSQVALEATISASINSFQCIGSGDKILSDHFATEGMREYLTSIHFAGTVIIGEGEIDEAPMLYNGENFANGLHKYDIAVDPLEGTNLCANGLPNAVSVIAIGEKDCILQIPEVYMQKIASCKVFEPNVIDIRENISQNVKNLSKYLKKDIKDIGIATLLRDRHNHFIQELRTLGVKVYGFTDGDIMATLETSYKDNIDLYFGIGGSPEGILSAASIKGLGGFMQAKIIPYSEDDKKKLQQYNIYDYDRIYEIGDMIRNDVIFCATAITSGDLLNGVKKVGDKFITNSIMIDSKKKAKYNITREC